MLARHALETARWEKRAVVVGEEMNAAMTATSLVGPGVDVLRWPRHNGLIPRETKINLLFFSNYHLVPLRNVYQSSTQKHLCVYVESLSCLVRERSSESKMERVQFQQEQVGCENFFV